MTRAHCESDSKILSIQEGEYALAAHIDFQLGGHIPIDEGVWRVKLNVMKMEVAIHRHRFYNRASVILG
jgi:hypothetical protein